jgi:diguanylate cyclase (GGDEF)-like protein
MMALPQTRARHSPSDGGDMQQILLVEDSNMYGRLAKSRIEKAFDLPVYWCKTLAETEELLARAKGNFSMALLDFNLPDAPHGEVIDKVVGEGITTFVFTADWTDEVRSLVWSKKVADYIQKEDPNSLDYLLAAMQQIPVNQHTLVLVVGEDAQFRTTVAELLYVRKFRVVTAQDGKTAQSILDTYREIQLVLVDFAVRDMDGCTLCTRIREKRKRETLAIIGFSSPDDGKTGARFIKSGADDVIARGLLAVEEFYCRITRCLETIRLIAQIRQGAITDFLTGLHNRRHFFEAGAELLGRCRRAGDNLACVMLDIDFFKKINDTYGHDVGDMVIKGLARLLRNSAAAGDIVARIGGEEFCLLVPQLSGRDLLTRLERLREDIAATPMATPAGAAPLQVTVSIGACLESGESLDAMMKTADERLYTAKNSGRNRVVS